MTEAERKALMGLPADWAVCGNESARSLQIGNGVVVGLMQNLIQINL